jgi:hypothetical protein
MDEGRERCTWKVREKSARQGRKGATHQARHVQRRPVDGLGRQQRGRGLVRELHGVPRLAVVADLPEREVRKREKGERGEGERHGVPRLAVVADLPRSSGSARG